MSGSWNHLPPNNKVELKDAREIRGERLAIRQLNRAVRAFGIEQIEQAARAAVEDVARDVERLRRLIEIAGLVKREDLFVRLVLREGARDIGQDGHTRRRLRLPRLLDGNLRVRDVALIAIAERQVERDAGAKRADGPKAVAHVVEAAVDVARAVADFERGLIGREPHAALCREQIRTGRERHLFQALERDRDLRVRQVADDLEVFGDCLVAEELAKRRFRLDERELGSGDVLIELKSLERDLEEVALGEIAGRDAYATRLDGL